MTTAGPGTYDAQSFVQPATLQPFVNLQSAGQEGVINLFDATVRQTGVTQLGKIFPTTIALITGSMPALGSGLITALTNGGNVCGAVFSPDPKWQSVFLDLAVVGQNAADTTTIEIGRVKASGGIAEVLASVVLTASTVTLVDAADPFSGVLHASVTWRFPDATTITSNSSLGDVLQSLGGTAGNLSQLAIAVNTVGWFYVVVTALSDGGTRTSEILCDITPTS